MKISSKPCGDYQTNCYVISKNGREIIIDPGQDSYDFVVKNSHAPLTILNTHGHFDHVLDNVSLKNFFNVPVYIHKDDNFMLHDDLWDAGQQPMYDAIYTVSRSRRQNDAKSRTCKPRLLDTYARK